ncbi:MAG: sulfite exporter TauE/SafE family protein [Aestuariivirga sp.]
MLELAFACVVVFLAAIVRGFSGFGFSLLAITALSLIYTPAQIVPSIFMMELVASINLLPSVWKDVHWRSLVPLSLGCFVATPIGVWALANVPAPPMQLALSIFVLIAVGLLAMNFALKTMPGPIASTAAGAASGLANGAFGIGGPPVVLFYFASPAGNFAGRASIIVFFIFTDTVGLANQYVQNLITWDTAQRALLFLPLMLFGVWIGARSFKSVDQALFRKIVLAVLALLAVLIGIKAGMELK